MIPDSEITGSDLRQLAVSHLRKRREFPGGFYWPMVPLLIWGIGLVFHAMDAFSSVFSPASPSEEKIRREIARLNRR